MSAAPLLRAEKELRPAQAVVKKRSWPRQLIWIIPLLAATFTGFLLVQWYQERGIPITIAFPDATGLIAGETRVLDRGAEVGRVSDIELSADHRHALVHVRIHRDQSDFATQGAQFWVVRPEISQLELKGLDTLLTGPYIHASPGSTAATAREFDGLTHEPAHFEPGEKFVVTMPHRGHVQDGGAVLYKGIPVGAVERVELSRDATHVNVQVIVWNRYAHLVRAGSRFWVNSGFDFRGGIFSGVHLQLDSLQALLTGAIEFATPEKDYGGPAGAGHQFALVQDPKPEWRDWSPAIPVSPRARDAVVTTESLPAKRPSRH